MLQELADENKNQGLKMNKSKTKVMMENDTIIYVNKSRMLKSTSTSAGWAAFAKHCDIFNANIGTCLKRQVYN